MAFSGSALPEAADVSRSEVVSESRSQLRYIPNIFRVANMAKRRILAARFKAKVASEALLGDKTVARDHSKTPSARPSPARIWKVGFRAPCRTTWWIRPCWRLSRRKTSPSATGVPGLQGPPAASDRSDRPMLTRRTDISLNLQEIWRGIWLVSVGNDKARAHGTGWVGYDGCGGRIWTCDLQVMSLSSRVFT